MRIPFLAPSPDEVVPLWRNPEVGFLDWLIQLVFPTLAPFGSMTRAYERDDPTKLHKLLAKFDRLDARQHDKMLAKWKVTELSIPSTDGTQLPVILCRPPGATDDELLPVVVWAHGGGMTIGAARSMYGAGCALELLKLCGPRFAWASVNYRLAPEHAWPAGPRDYFAALEYFQSGACAGIDGASIHAAGNSAGAGVAAAAVSAAVRSGVVVRSLMVDIPMIDPACDRPSFTTHGATTIAPVDWVRWSWSACYPRGRVDDEAGRWLVLPELVAPANLEPAGPHPPTVVMTCSADPLRDEGRAYAEAMRQAGKLVAHVEAKGGHALWRLDGRAAREVMAAWAGMLCGSEES